jgi:DNA-binding GntR family transcriptional regulator
MRKSVPDVEEGPAEMRHRRSQPTLGAAHAPLRDQVREEIRQRISDGRLAPGDKMVERELAAELGVSRVPVREALRTLETEGFVQVVPRKGVVVRHLSRRDVEELFDVREALEVLATRRAAERATADELARLRRTLDKGRAALRRGDNVTAQACNEAFHDAIVTMAHNELLGGLLEPLQGRLHWLFRQNEDLAELVDEHRELYAAIASGDPDRAGVFALEHVRVNREIALRLLFDHKETGIEAPA